MRRNSFAVKRTARFGMLVTTIGMISLAGAAKATALYTVTDLGALGNVTGMNDSGQVTGWFFPATGGPERGFITGPNGAGFTVLNNLGGIETDANAINNAGQVVGLSVLPAGGAAINAFITGTNGAGITDLGALASIPGVPSGVSAANGVNNLGQVVGNSWVNQPGFPNHAFVTGPNGVGMTDLGAFGGLDSSAIGINDSGQVVGNYETTAGLGHAFMTGPNATGMQDLGVVTAPEGYNESFAKAINASGEVVGNLQNGGGGGTGAFITGPNGVGMRELTPNGGSSASAINAAGQVVGFTVRPTGGLDDFVTGPNGVGLYNLNNLGIFTNVPNGFLDGATAINDRGQIVAGALNGHSYLLTPNFVTLVNQPGGTASHPTLLQAGTPVGMIGGAIGGSVGASQFYEFDWTGGLFSATIAMAGTGPLDQFLFELLNSDGTLDLEAALNGSNGFMGTLAGDLLPGVYSIGLAANGDDDPQFTIDFSTPVDGPAGAVAEPSTLAIFLCALLVFGAVHLPSKKSRL